MPLISWPMSASDHLPMQTHLVRHSNCIWNHRLLRAIGLADVWTFNWCGSAVLGGYLLDWYGFRVSFALTTIFQTMAWSLLLLLLPVVPAQEGAAAAPASAQPPGPSVAAEAVVVANEPELAEPLLAAES